MIFFYLNLVRFGSYLTNYLIFAYFLVIILPPGSPSSSTDSGMVAEDSQPSRDVSDSESSGSDGPLDGVTVELWVRIHRKIVVLCIFLKFQKIFLVSKMTLRKFQPKLT